MDKPGKTVKRKWPRGTFTLEFKAEAVRLCGAGDRSIAQVAKDLALTETALREWVQRADVDAGKGPAGVLTCDERAELARLGREVKEAPDGAREFKFGGGVLREERLMRFAFVHSERDAYPITALYSVIRAARSRNHLCAVRTEHDRVCQDRVLSVHVAAALERSRHTYGSPRI